MSLIARSGNGSEPPIGSMTATAENAGEDAAALENAIRERSIGISADGSSPACGCGKTA